MAGRPRTRAKKITELEARALQLADDFYALMPSMYRDPRTLHTDPICRAWNDAMDRILETLHTIEHLGNLLREKAGVRESGPLAVYQNENTQPLKIAENDGKA
ncbi:MAG: hypothetical protein HJJLKODD_03034 [Phycisphaerae bacterium]|nr:hypothetical protein [Phycisphaerae bacterium]